MTTEFSIETVEKQIKLAYNKGYEAGCRVKKGKWKLNQLLNRYDTLRKEYNQRIKEAHQDMIKIEDVEKMIDNFPFINYTDFEIGEDIKPDLKQQLKELGDK
jgi:hypothetical protein